MKQSINRLLAFAPLAPMLEHSGTAADSVIFFSAAFAVALTVDP